MPNLEPLGVAAASLGVDPDLLKFWCRQRMLRYVRIGHQWLIDPADLAEFVSAHTVEVDEARRQAVG